MSMCYQNNSKLKTGVVLDTKGDELKVMFQATLPM